MYETGLRIKPKAGNLLVIQNQWHHHRAPSSALMDIATGTLADDSMKPLRITARELFLECLCHGIIYTLLHIRIGIDDRESTRTHLRSRDDLLLVPVDTHCNGNHAIVRHGGAIAQGGSVY